MHRHRLRSSRSRLRTAVLAAVAAAALALAPVLTRAQAAEAASSPYETHQWAHPSAPEQWLGCRAIWYRINPSDMPAGMATVVRRSMAQIGRQTGVPFHDAGTTTRRYGSKAYSPYNPTVYLSFTRQRHVAGTTFSSSGVVGTGGESAASYGNGDWSFESITHGDVILYSGFHAPKYGPGVTWQSLILHEVGHALNLAHRTSVHDVMYPELTASAPGRYSAAEVQALKRVVKRTSCHYDRFTAMARAQQR